MTERDNFLAVYSLYEEVSKGTDRRVWLCYKQDFGGTSRVGVGFLTASAA